MLAQEKTPSLRSLPQMCASTLTEELLYSRSFFPPFFLLQSHWCRPRCDDRGKKKGCSPVMPSSPFLEVRKCSGYSFFRFCTFQSTLLLCPEASFYSRINRSSLGICPLGIGPPFLRPFAFFSYGSFHVAIFCLRSPSRCRHLWEDQFPLFCEPLFS